MIGVLERIRIGWLVLILLSALACLVVPRLGVRLEDVQTILLPVCLVAFWRLPKEKSLGLPLPLVISAAVFWVVATLHQFYRPAIIGGGNLILVGRLLNDVTGEKVQLMINRTNEIARAFGLLKAESVQRTFESVDDARIWLEQERPTSSLLVLGSKEDPKVVISKAVSFGIYHKLNSELQLVSGRDILPVRLWWSDKPFYFRGAPTQVPLSMRAEDLSLHYLAWLGTALEVDSSSISATDFRKETIRESRRDALRSIISLEGPWHVGAMPGLAYSLLGGSLFMEGLDSNNFVLVEEALSLFRKASSFIHPKYAPEMYADLFNNAAVALLDSASDLTTMLKAREWLMLAHLQERYMSYPSDGVLAAQLNLISLDQALSNTREFVSP